ncbi:unnamed protein product [Callosobruchus maculatus]|uniref:SprT-like domain-containing protein n=1 Tax=Callosobruchus maculatus TaxID=64391 RepID=A0A653DTS8_CALMS|nr:unnamed protein product [Callosobruchus maculatus]
MDESIVLLSSMSPKIKHKRCRKGISLLAIKSHIRRSSIYKPSPQNYNDVSLVEEGSGSSSSYESDKPIVVNDEPIVISDTSESGESMKEGVDPMAPLENLENCAYLQDNAEPDKKDFIQKWIEDVAIETSFKDGSVFTEMSTIHGIDNEFIPKEKGNAINSTFAKGTEKRFDELFKNKQQVDNFENSMKNLRDSFMESLVVKDSFETAKSDISKGGKNSLTNSGNDKPVINDSFQYDKNEMRNSKAKNSSILTNDESNSSYKLSGNKENTIIVRNSILTNDDSDLSVHKNTKLRVSYNSILTNDESNSSSTKPIIDDSLQNFEQNLSNRSRRKKKSSVNSINKENVAPAKNSPCTPQTNIKQISHYNNRKCGKQAKDCDGTPDVSSGGESGVESDDNVKDAEKLLDAIYGNSWREKQELILPKTEPRKNKVRPKVAENLSHSERRNPKKSHIYKNPYLEFDRDSSGLQKTPNQNQIQKHVSPSPLLEKLKKLCDSDTTSDEDHHLLHKQKLNFDTPDGKTSKYFNEKVKTPELSDEFDLPDIGQSLEERIKKKMNNIHVGDTLKIKAINNRKNRMKESGTEDRGGKLNPLKAISGIGLVNSEGDLKKQWQNDVATPDHSRNSKSSSLEATKIDSVMLDIGSSIVKKKKPLQSDETSSFESHSDSKKVQTKDKKVDRYFETNSSSATSSETDEKVQKDSRKQPKDNKKVAKPRSRSVSSLEDDRIEKDSSKKPEGKNSKKVVQSRRYSTSSSEPEANPKIDRAAKKVVFNPATNFDEGNNRVTRKKGNIFLGESDDSDESDDEFDKRVSRIHRSSYAHGAYSFLESLSGSVPLYTCDFKARVYRNNYKNKRDELAAELFKLYNKKIFESKIPEDTPLKWNDRMRGTAGYCYCRKITRSNGNIERLVRIELASKVLDSPDRLRDTLVHELCHAAAWIINGVSDGHGKYWKSWAYKAMSTFPELPPIKRCHDYVLNTKYTYKCTGCGYSIGRHTKSLDTERKRCGHCYGKFEVLINKVSKKGESKSVPATPKKGATGFALFVKENYGAHKTPDRKHGDVMRILGQKFQEMKVKK